MRTSRKDILSKRIAFLKNVSPFTDLREKDMEESCSCARFLLYWVGDENKLSMCASNGENW